MVFCNFYQRGSCKFGKKCRYEHVLLSNLRSGGRTYDVVPNMQSNHRAADQRTPLSRSPSVQPACASVEETNFLALEQKYIFEELIINMDCQEASHHLNSIIQRNKSMYKELLFDQLDPAVKKTIQTLLTSHMSPSNTMIDRLLVNIKLRRILEDVLYGIGTNGTDCDIEIYNQNESSETCHIADNIAPLKWIYPPQTFPTPPPVVYSSAPHSIIPLEMVMKTQFTFPPPPRQMWYQDASTSTNAIGVMPAQGFQNNFGPSQPAGNTTGSIFLGASQNLFNSPPKQQEAPDSGNKLF